LRCNSHSPGGLAERFSGKNMFRGLAGAWRQVVDVNFRNISQRFDLFFQQLLFAQFGVQFLAAAVVLRELLEMPAQFPE